MEDLRIDNHVHRRHSLLTEDLLASLTYTCERRPLLPALISIHAHFGLSGASMAVAKAFYAMLSSRRPPPVGGSVHVAALSTFETDISDAFTVKGDHPCVVDLTGDHDG